MDADALTTKAYWAREGGKVKPVLVGANAFASVLERYLPVDPGLRCVEIGAYPGANLCYLAKRFGYRPTAIEYRDDADDIESLFAHNGVEDLTIIKKSFLDVVGLKFDVVASFGFVEHFRDYENVIFRHAEMVEEGGYLVISVPHLFGLQGLLRRILFREESLKSMVESHNLAIMNLAVMKRVLRAGGLEILFAGYAMGFRFWIPCDSPKIRNDMRWLASLVNKFDKRFGSRMPSCRFYSPMILTVSKKSEKGPRRPGRREITD
jgi:2-polyprenyl-3-methyl-5-hydroxy-6-metoxy-1,4-benzoquinol methylase